LNFKSKHILLPLVGLLLGSLLVGAATGSAQERGDVGTKQAMQRATFLYDSGLRLLADGKYDVASDQFQSCLLAAKELLAGGDLSEEDSAVVHTLADKARHLSTRALQRTVVLDYTSTAASPVPEDLSSYAGYDSVTTAPRLPAVQPEMNRKVEQWVDFYSNRGSKVFTNWLRRSVQYMDMVKDILRSEGVPEELAYLILVESGFNLQARSWAHAVGPWQFILGTAKLFGLKVDPWIDERCDPEKSTVAAARYLKHLYTLFDSWPLAIAAYNSGEGTVKRALQKQNTRDFWRLRLPRQTTEYVPQFMAALEVASDPEKYGVATEVPPAVAFEEVLVRGSVDLKKISQICEAPLETVKLLNPSFRRTKSPPRRGGIKVRVPAGTATGYISALAVDGITAEMKPPVQFGQLGQYSLPGSGAATSSGIGSVVDPKAWADESDADEELYITYKVRKGDSLYRIARNFGTSVQEIEEYNDISRKHIIKPGQRLYVPRDNVKLAGEPSTRSVRRLAKLEHIVRRGDTLYGIARAYGVKVQDIVKWNNLDSARLIRIGQKLVILPDNTPGA